MPTMYKQCWSLMFIAFTIHACFSFVESISLSGVSWIFRGTAQQNNTVLTFNVYDTLNLICRADGVGIFEQVIFAISKGNIPTSMTFTGTGSLTISDVGTLIWTDVYGIESGFENFNIYGGSYDYPAMYNTFTHDFRYFNVGILKTTDSGVYVCAGAYMTAIGSPVPVKTSGSLTITVNTKSDQARSSRMAVNRFLAYSAAVLGASKFIF